MKFKEWFEQNRDDLINAPNTETVSELTWRACMEQTKQVCFEAVDILVGADGYVCVHPDEIKNAIMQAEVD